MAGGTVKQCGHRGTRWQMLEILNIKLPRDPTIPILGIHLEELRADTGTNVTTAHRSTTHNGRPAGQPEYPLAGQWVEKRSANTQRSITRT